MHEYPITCEIVSIATRFMTENRGTRVTRINLVAGDNSGYVGDSIQLYFDEISKGTPCEGALVDIRRVIPKLRCEACGELFVRRPFSFSCPSCGGQGAPTEIGKEFYVDSIEIEADEGQEPGKEL